MTTRNPIEVQGAEIIKDGKPKKVFIIWAYNNEKKERTFVRAVETIREARLAAESLKNVNF